MRYTEEELSRILGEHDAGQLRRGGAGGWWHGVIEQYPRGCANQVAYNEDESWEAFKRNAGGGRCFDTQYRPDLTPAQLLWLLEAK